MQINCYSYDSAVKKDQFDLVIYTITNLYDQWLGKVVWLVSSTKLICCLPKKMVNCTYHTMIDTCNIFFNMLIFLILK